MRQILACVDFSDATDAVVREAAALAGPDGRLHLIHVATPEPVLAGYDPDDGPGDLAAVVAGNPPAPLSEHTRDQRAGELAAEHEQLHRLAEAQSVETVALLMMDGPEGIVATILREADRVGADTIVAGTHGHGVLHRIALGSTSAALAHHATRPVLLVPVRQR